MVSVATSRFPIRTSAVGAGLVAVVALVLPHLLGWLQPRAAAAELGVLITPLLAAASARISTIAVPVAAVAGVLGAGLGALQVMLAHRHRQRRVGDVPERVLDS